MMHLNKNTYDAIKYDNIQISCMSISRYSGIKCQYV